MIGKKISHYKILEEIGSGGMGVVYKAEDCKLKRTVALKFVVPRMLKKKEDKERFIREAQTAASLNHPHICTIYGIDEFEDSTFIVMEYVEGVSLKETIAKKPLDLDEALGIAIQLADGLQEACDREIVHRDIKSSNVMVTPRGLVKIMDFGLAKIVSDAQLTETASIMGTVAYMSPEQAMGDAVDHRSDIWSLGVVMYEMLSGQLPFTGEFEQLVLYSILNNYHKPLNDIIPSISVEVERIVDRCLEKDPSERYQRAEELLEDLRRLKKETESGILPQTRPTWKRRRAKKRRNILVPGIIVFAAAALISGYYLFDRFNPFVPKKVSIAVLPIENMSSQLENDALCVHTTKDIIRKISLLSEDLMRVVPYDYTVLHSRQDKTSINIGNDLNVDYVLDSTLQSDGDILIINSDLILVKENSVVDSFESKTSKQDNISIFDIQDEISKAIVGELGIHFTESGLIAAKKDEPRNEEAYKWYVQGLDIIDNRDIYSPSDEWFPEAIRMMRRALEMDPNYALAQWGLGAAFEAHYVATGNEDDRKLAIEHFLRAYELNPESAEANLARGWAYFYKEDLEEAAKSFKRALDIDATSPLVNCDVGVFLVSVGLYHPSLKYYDRAIQLEPFYIRAYELSSPCYWYTGEYEKGYELIKRALELDSTNTKLFLEMAGHLIMLKKYDEAEKAIQEFEKRWPESPESDHFRALLFASKQERNKALELIRGTEKPFVYSVTCVYALLGMKDAAIENIRLGIELGFKESQHYLYSYMILKENPCFDSLRDDPRFEEILRKQREIYYSRLNKARDIL